MNDWIIWEMRGDYYDDIMNRCDYNTLIAHADAEGIDPMFDYILSQCGI